MKKINIILMLLILTMVFTSCSKAINNEIVTKSTQKEEIVIIPMNEIDLEIEEITAVNVTMYPEFYDAFYTKDIDEINTIIEYISSLNLIDSQVENLSDMGMGGGFVIEIDYENDSSRELHLYGNKYFYEDETKIYELDYLEATHFSVIVCDILEKININSGLSSIKGKVFSVDSASNGHSVACAIVDTNGKTQDIYISDAKVMDKTGNGKLIIDINDEITVYYDGEKGIIAKTVYIDFYDSKNAFN